MRAEYKYIRFEHLSLRQSGFEAKWLCFNRKSSEQEDVARLAGIVWSPRWKQWLFIPNEDSNWTTDCLADVIDFIKQLGAPK